jgi:glucose-1-phosphate thymidylyltransferase
LTFTSAKQLVPVANKPVLYYGLEAVVEAGIKNIGVVVGDTREEIKAALGDGSRFGARITYIEQEAPLGLAHAVLVAEPFLEDEPFVMYLGDNLIAGGISSLVDEYRQSACNAMILLSRVPNPQQFGVAELDEKGRVVCLQEKPDDPRSDLALVGVYMFDAQIFESVRRIRPSARGELEITDAIQDLIDRGLEVQPHLVQGWWKDTGKLDDMLEANRIVLESLEMGESNANGGPLEGRVLVGEGVEMNQSLVRGPAVIGAGARLENAFVGPYTSIGEGCTLVRCEVENSIILGQSEIRDIPGRIEGSLVGRGVRIVRTGRKPKAHRFMLGDKSEVGIP